MAIGMANSNRITTIANAVLTSFDGGKQKYGSALFQSVVILLCFALIVVIAVAVSFLIRLLYRRRYKRILENLEEACRPVRDQLRSLAEELNKETLFDRNAHVHLKDCVDRTCEVVEYFSCRPSVHETRRFAQRLWCLSSAIDIHADKEIREASICAPSESVKAVVRRISCGVKCVGLLLEHLRNEIRSHPAY
ncbi:MAG: hypothetical protein NTZ09_21785 [Candidatus Hydrogenedentes bacterium]|nr:hypothetical protein [Candidatus Hydrogenedentota bacterium]